MRGGEGERESERRLFCVRGWETSMMEDWGARERMEGVQCASEDVAQSQHHAIIHQSNEYY